jgi:hypothetical protein
MGFSDLTPGSTTVLYGLYERFEMMQTEDFASGDVNTSIALIPELGRSGLLTLHGREEVEWSVCFPRYLFWKL